MSRAVFQIQLTKNSGVPVFFILLTGSVCKPRPTKISTQIHEQEKHLFYISTPRTRSTWLANLFTYQDTFCYHEALRHCASVNDLKKLLAGHPESHLGNADSDLIPVMDEVMREFPGSRILIVERDLEDAIRSFLTLVPGNSYPQAYKFFKAYADKLEQIKEGYSCMIVPFHGLGNIKVVRCMWEYLIPNIPFNESRFRLLDEMRVNVVLKKMLLNSRPDSLAIRLRNQYLNL